MLTNADCYIPRSGDVLIVNVSNTYKVVSVAVSNNNGLLYIDEFTSAFVTDRCELDHHYKLLKEKSNVYLAY
jgi:hypothetical protein